jgi:hypothetical protein
MTKENGPPKKLRADPEGQPSPRRFSGHHSTCTENQSIDWRVSVQESHCDLGLVDVDVEVGS